MALFYINIKVLQIKHQNINSQVPITDLNLRRRVFQSPKSVSFSFRKEDEFLRRSASRP